MWFGGVNLMKQIEGGGGQLFCKSCSWCLPKCIAIDFLVVMTVEFSDLRWAVSLLYNMMLLPIRVWMLLQCWLQEGDLVTILEADRSPAGLPPLPAHQVTTVHWRLCKNMQESENCIARPKKTFFKYIIPKLGPNQVWVKSRHGKRLRLPRHLLRFEYSSTPFANVSILL